MMWRTFASSFVDHTFDTYIKHSDRSETAPVTKTRRKIDLKTLFPYNHSQEEIDKRGKMFIELKKKVEKQRAEIKSREFKISKEKIIKVDFSDSRRAKVKDEKRYSSTLSWNIKNKKLNTTMPLAAEFRTKSLPREEELSGIFALTTGNIAQPLGLSSKRNSLNKGNSYQGKLLEMFKEKNPDTKVALRNQLKQIWNEKN
ncbi:unnamed protein product [Blepharisma stoltei]|uniref:Uncharacterized protein n=1 Tax=Blepharisma stoltei TaxID=1481888 RepID=A0AAU9K765_9CILI|nr:unnamed protein product [Blepharisma stoltei]